MFVETGQQSAQKPADTARADDRYSRFHRPDRIWFYDAKIAKRTSARHPGAKKNIGFLRRACRKKADAVRATASPAVLTALAGFFGLMLLDYRAHMTVRRHAPLNERVHLARPTGDPVDKIAHREHLRNAPPSALSRSPASPARGRRASARFSGRCTCVSFGSKPCHCVSRSTYRPDRTSSG